MGPTPTDTQAATRFRQTSWLIDWRRVPWTLWLVAVFFLITVVRVEVETSIHVKLRIFVVLFMVAWAYLLFKGIRNVWIGTLALFAISVLVEIVTDLTTDTSPNLLGWVISLIVFALLLLPVTRRFFARPVTPA